MAQLSRMVSRKRYKDKTKLRCPKCKSDKVKKGSDFYLCNNPHCLHLWSRK